MVPENVKNHMENKNRDEPEHYYQPNDKEVERNARENGILGT